MFVKTWLFCRTMNTFVSTACENKTRFTWAVGYDTHWSLYSIVEKATPKFSGNMCS